MEKKLTGRAARHARALGGNQKVRFILAGIANTLVDFAVFNLLILLFTLHVAPANIIATTTAMTVSYLLNKKAVFRNGDPHNIRQVALFLGFTLFGIWVVQTGTMLAVLHVLENMFTPETGSFLEWFLRNAAKASGIVFGAVWSYLTYSRIVFRKTGEEKS